MAGPFVMVFLVMSFHSFYQETAEKTSALPPFAADREGA